jgi:molybdate transport system substrate-binding protein
MSGHLSTWVNKFIAGSWTTRYPRHHLRVAPDNSGSVPVWAGLGGWAWLVLATCLLGSVPISAASLTVAAAADISAAESDLTSSFHETYPSDTVRFVFAASGALAQQIANGAPYDVFLSANEAFVDQLVSTRKILPDTDIAYALGRVGILWKDGKAHPLNDLTTDLVRFVAIANPKLAPYGLAAEQALRHENLWDKLGAKIVFGENVRQTLQLFDSGNADAVLTSYSLINNRPGATVVPDNWHQPIRQKAGVVASSANQKLARKFVAFLEGPKGSKILVKHGLTPVR